jgi:hypothetical protein
MLSAGNGLTDGSALRHWVATSDSGNETVSVPTYAPRSY